MATHRMNFRRKCPGCNTVGYVAEIKENEKIIELVCYHCKNRWETEALKNA
jgi:transcription elongation factor Elf1